MHQCRACTDIGSQAHNLSHALDPPPAAASRCPRMMASRLRPFPGVAGEVTAVADCKRFASAAGHWAAHTHGTVPSHHHSRALVLDLAVGPGASRRGPTPATWPLAARMAASPCCRWCLAQCTDCTATGGALGCKCSSASAALLSLCNMPAWSGPNWELWLTGVDSMRSAVMTFRQCSRAIIGTPAGMHTAT